MCVCMCVCACVCEREREIEKKEWGERINGIIIIIIMIVSKTN